MVAATRRLVAVLVLTSLRLALAEHSDDDDFLENAQDYHKWTWKHFVVAAALAAFVAFIVPILICKCLGKLLCEAVELVVCCPCKTLKCLCCGGGGKKSRGLELEDSDEDTEDEDTQEEQLVDRGTEDPRPSATRASPTDAGVGAPGQQGAPVLHHQAQQMQAQQMQAQQMQMMHHQQLLYQQHYAHQQAAAMAGAPAPQYHYGYPGQHQQGIYAR